MKRILFLAAFFTFTIALSAQTDAAAAASETMEVVKKECAKDCKKACCTADATKKACTKEGKACCKSKAGAKACSKSTAAKKSCTKPCAKTCTKGKTASLKTMQFNDATAAKIANMDESIERRECSTSGKVSYFKSYTCSTSGKMVSKEVTFDEKNSAFVDVISPSNEKTTPAKNTAEFK